MKSFSIRLLYLYLFSFVGLIIAVIGVIRLIDLGMKVFIFQGADQYSYYLSVPVKTPETDNMTIEEQNAEEARQKMQQEVENKRQRQREFSGAVSMIVVGIPLYLYHWKTIQNENRS